MTDWPEHFPEKCPPIEAKSPSGCLYRFTNRRTPRLRDFKSLYELRDEDWDWGEEACKARGLSVFLTLADCTKMRAAVPAMKKKHIASASLSPDAGLVAHTPSNNSDAHHTFWSKLAKSQLVDAFNPHPSLEAIKDD